MPARNTKSHSSVRLLHSAPTRTTRVRATLHGRAHTKSEKLRRTHAAAGAVRAESSSASASSTSSASSAAASSSSSGAGASAAGTAWYRSSIVKNGLVVAGLVSGATVIAYNFTGFIMSFNPRYWVYLGFLGGVTFATLLGAAGVYIVRNITILPENVFRQAVRVLKANKYVSREIGSVQPGELKAYHLERGFVGFRDGRFRWFHPNVQMMFSVGRDSGAAPVLAYVDAERTAVGLQLRNVCLLLADADHGFSDAEVVQIVGTDKDIAERRHLQDRLIESKKAYLATLPWNEAFEA